MLVLNIYRKRKIFINEKVTEGKKNGKMENEHDIEKYLNDMDMQICDVCCCSFACSIKNILLYYSFYGGLI